MKIVNRLYLVENITFKDLDKIKCAVIIASCQTQARIYAEKRWPNIEMYIVELNRKYIDKLVKLDDILLCEETIHD